MRRVVLLLGLGLALGLVGSVETGRGADTQGGFFNGKNLEGWEGLKEYWKVENGAIVGSTLPDGLKFNTFLCSTRKYKDFSLRFQIRLKEGKGNSGIQIRSEVFDKEKLAVKGAQCDIGEGYWGSLYGEHIGGMMKEAPRDEVNKVLKKDDFNEYFIFCKGKHVTIKINGVTTVDGDFEKMADEGIIAWQLHSGGPMEVTFKGIEFKDLSAK